MNKNSKIYIAGHTGLVGSALVRRLKYFGYKNILVSERKQLDLKNYNKTFNFLKKNKPQFIFNAAAKVGGILYNNSKKAEFIYDNITIQNNLIHSAYKNRIKNLIFFGSSCVYPKLCKQPIKEDYLLSGKLEKTNEAYAIAKIAGIKMCESYNFQYNTNYKCLMPANTYGPNDKYHSLNSHFIPALIKKLHHIKNKKNKKIILWGNGKPKREILYVDDIADAAIYFMKKKTSDAIINIGSGIDYSIKEYVKILAEVILPNHKIKINFDKTKPNGTPRKLLDISLACAYGWKAKVGLIEGIKKTYSDYLSNISH